MNISVRVDGVEKLDRVIARVHSGMARAIGAATFAIGQQIQRTIAVYPPRPRYPLRWASAQQRKAYVEMRRARKLGPYRRMTDPFSQHLGKKWTVERLGRMGAMVGTTVTYAPYVQSAQRQQPFHADTGWITDEEAVQRVSESGVVGQIVGDALRTLIAG